MLEEIDGQAHGRALGMLICSPKAFPSLLFFNSTFLNTALHAYSSILSCMNTWVVKMGQKKRTQPPDDGVLTGVLAAAMCTMHRVSTPSTFHGFPEAGKYTRRSLFFLDDNEGQVFSSVDKVVHGPISIMPYSALLIFSLQVCVRPYIYSRAQTVQLLDTRPFLCFFFFRFFCAL